jgi:hypothetical protein
LELQRRELQRLCLRPQERQLPRTVRRTRQLYACYLLHAVDALHDHGLRPLGPIAKRG